MPGAPETCTISGIIQDPSGQIFANGSWQLILKDAPNAPGPSRNNAIPPSLPLTRIFGGSLDATGAFAQGAVVRTDFIAPAGALYTLVVTPNASGQAYSIDFAATSPSVNVSTLINAIISNIQVQSFPVAHAYKDAEVIPVPGSGGIYFDVTKKALKSFDSVGGVWLEFDPTSTPTGTGFRHITAGVEDAAAKLVAQSDVINGYVDLVNNQTIAGNKTFSGDTKLTSRNGLAVVYADQFANVQAAITALPSTGGIVDATSPNTNLTLGALDTGSNTKIVTLLLGPYTYTFTQIIVRQGFNIVGAGTLDTLLNNNGTNANPAFVIPQVNNNIITIHWSDFTVNGLSGNTSQDGIFFDGSTLTNAGVAYSTFINLIFLGFNGSGIHLKATQNGVSGSVGAIQGNTFINVQSTRPNGATGATQNALRIEGACGQNSFWNCWFLGTTNDTGTNVFVGTSGTSNPYSIHFKDCTNQNGFAYTIDGANSVTTQNDHFENIKGCYNLLTSSQLFVGLNFRTPYINSNVGVNAGNGYIVNIPNTVTNGDVVLDTPHIFSTPDNVIKNTAGNACSVNVLLPRTFNSASPTNVYVSSGVTGVLNPAATVDLKSWTSVQVNASATSITTFKNTLMPGGIVTLYATGGTIQFASGGNLSLGNQSSPFILQAGDSATFIRVDAGASAFVLVGFSQNGLRAFTSQKSESAADANVLTFTPLATTGLYRLSFVLDVSAATAAILGWTATWKDSNGNAQAPTNLNLNQSGIAVPALTFTLAAAGILYGMAIISTDASATNIVIKLTFTGTSFAAKVSTSIERVI